MTSLYPTQPWSLLGEWPQVTDYFSQRRAVRQSRTRENFSIDRPHTCCYCQEIVIDIAACRDAWHVRDPVPCLGTEDNYSEQEDVDLSTAYCAFHSHFRQVLWAARQGCAFCVWMADGLLHWALESSGPFLGWDAFDVIFALLTTDTPAERFRLMFELVNSDGTIYERVINQSCPALRVWTPQDDIAANYVSTRPFELDTGSAKSFRFARDALQTCIQKHNKCTWARDRFAHWETQFPTRLLNIQNLRGIFKVALVHSAEMDAPLKDELHMSGYSVLSYCWGDHQELKLTADTLHRLQAGIDTRELPQTLQDAVRVSNALGLSFVWIDALCIAQDDGTDKEREIARMPLYYGRSMVTLSAARAGSCADGFLGKGKSDIGFRYGPFAISCDTPAGRGTVQLFWPRGLPTEPIHTRAWTLQESILPPRILIYASSQLYWRCQERVVDCQDTPYFDYCDQLFKYNPYDFGERIGNDWADPVMQYSKRHLTVSSDKLSAIAALAEHMVQKAAGGLTYVAGLLVDRSRPRTWINQLAWAADPPRSMRRTTFFRAPSWSWACGDGAVNLDWFRMAGRLESFLDDAVFRVNEMTVELSSESAPFGAVKSAFLSVSGRAKRILSPVGLEIRFPNEGWNGSRSITDLSLFPDTEEDGLTVEQCIASRSGNASVYFLELALVHYDGFSWQAFGLILQQNPEQGPNVYIRLGMFAWRTPEDLLAKTRAEAFFDEMLENIILV